MEDIGGRWEPYADLGERVTREKAPLRRVMPARRLRQAVSEFLEVTLCSFRRLAVPPPSKPRW